MGESPVAGEQFAAEDFRQGDVAGVVHGQVVTKVDRPGTSSSIIYLHTNPLDGLRVGEHVSRGQRIATEASRGASSAHTHIEMRPGREERAVVSVGDSTLSNPIPTTFWMNRGYNICCQ